MDEKRLAQVSEVAHRLVDIMRSEHKAGMSPLSVMRALDMVTSGMIATLVPDDPGAWNDTAEVYASRLSYIVSTQIHQPSVISYKGDFEPAYSDDEVVHRVWPEATRLSVGLSRVLEEEPDPEVAMAAVEKLVATALMVLTPSDEEMEHLLALHEAAVLANFQQLRKSLPSLDLH